MKIKNNTGRRYSIAGHECEAGDTITLDESAVSPAIRVLLASGALSVVKAPKAEKADK